jgi:hypothetical protein
LIGDIKTTSTIITSKPPTTRPAVLNRFTEDQLGQLQEMTLLLAAYEHMHDKIYYPEFEGGEGPHLPALPLPKEIQKAQVIMQPLFRVDEIMMPALIEQSAWCCVVGHPAAMPPPSPADPDQDRAAEVSMHASTLMTVDIRLLNDDFQTWSDTGGIGNDGPTPDYRFVQFVMHRYFNLGFSKWLFGTKYHYQDYICDFLGDSELFSDCMPWQIRIWEEFDISRHRYWSGKGSSQ